MFNVINTPGRKKQTEITLHYLFGNSGNKVKTFVLAQFTISTHENTFVVQKNIPKILVDYTGLVSVRSLLKSTFESF
jgi:hypothetical protein